MLLSLIVEFQYQLVKDNMKKKVSNPNVIVKLAKMIYAQSIAAIYKYNPIMEKL